MPIISVTPESKMTVAQIKQMLNIASDRDCDIVTITPEQAQILLDNTNVCNRSVSQSNVNDICKKLKAGEWQRTNDGISFDADGILSNGQHRLFSIIKTNTSCEILVVFGVARSTAVDTGKKRSFSDNLRVGNLCDDRLKDNDIYHKVFQTAWQYALGYERNKKIITQDQMANLMNAYADELLTCKEHGLFCNITTKGCNSVVIKSALFLAYLNGVELELLEHIVEVLKTGVGNGEIDTPIINLRDKLGTLLGGGREVNLLRAGYTESCIRKCVRKQKTKLRNAELCYTYNFQ